ncbi:MAG: hypothetical protein VKJ64_13660 [Leptolyngbyaceae bacterium]|nr:hypothetical protein [Leptolyngbyaceae bacterium]
MNTVTPEGDTDLSPPIRERSPSLLGWLGIVIFRAGILAIGGVIAMVAGMAIATRHPTTVDQPPLLEKVLQGIETIR